MLLLIIGVIFQGAKLVEKSHKTILRPIFYPFLALAGIDAAYERGEGAMPDFVRGAGCGGRGVVKMC